MSILMMESRMSRMLWHLEFALATHKWADQAEPTVLRALVDAAPVVTGQLRDSIHSEREMFGAGGMRIKFQSDVKQARFVIGGTRPHMIEAVNAKALAFTVGGESVFAARVQHPGASPNRFHERAYNQVRDEVLAGFRAAVVETLG